MTQRSTFDFDTLVDRRNTGSLKWDVEGESVPLWVADMDFDTAPAIKRAIIERASLGSYGYSVLTDRWYEAYIAWWKKRYLLELDRDYLVFSLGVVPSISSIVRRLTHPNENVVLLTPCYNIFFNSIVNNGARVLESRLLYDGEGYSIDFDDLERKLSDSQTTLMILSNPQNPTGNIWSMEDLGRIAELCYENGVVVISDEIHCDLTSPGFRYNPFMLSSDRAYESGIMLMSPSKSFNIAGLLTSALYIPNRRIKDRVVRGLNNDEIAEPAIFSVPAAVSAYLESEEWLEELRGVIYSNKEFAREYINNEISPFKALKSDSTYLLWVDISALTEDDEALAELVFRHNGVKVAPGSEYGSKGFIRINTATPRANLERGLRLLKEGVDCFKGTTL